MWSRKKRPAGPLFLPVPDSSIRIVSVGVVRRWADPHADGADADGKAWRCVIGNDTTIGQARIAVPVPWRALAVAAGHVTRVRIVEAGLARLLHDLLGHHRGGECGAQHRGCTEQLEVGHRSLLQMTISGATPCCGGCSEVPFKPA